MKFMKHLAWIITATIILQACTKDPEVGATDTVEMAGEWWIKYYESGAELTPYFKMITYNTATPGSGQVWVDDGQLWPLKAKLDVDLATLTFKPMTNAPNVEVTNGTVSVQEGKILKGAGRSLTGNPVDSIYLRVEFSDDPGTVYEIKGHYDTGFFEDHP